MHARRRRHPLSSWIAIFAFLLAALAPAVSQLLSPVGTDLVADVCRALDGQPSPRQVAAQDKGDASHHFEHCDWCSLHAPVGALPPAVMAFAASVPQRAGPPPRFLARPRANPVWRAAQPRGPPALA